MLACSTKTSAVSLLTLPQNANDGRVDLASYVGLLEDPSANLSIYEVRSLFEAGAVAPAKASGINLGYSRSAWWIGFQVPAKSTAEHLGPYLLELGFPTMDYIDYYAPGSETPVVTGDHAPFSQRPIVHRNFVFFLEPADTTSSLVVLRVKSEGTLSVPLTLWTASAFAEYSQATYAGLAVYFGALFALLIYNALLWLSIREQMYLDYVLFVTGLSIGLAGFNGLGTQFLWPNWPWFANLAFPLGFCLCTFGVAQFTRSFLSPHLVSPRLDFILRGSAAFSIASAIVSMWVSYAFGGKMLTALAAFTTSLAVWTGIYCLIRKVAVAKLFLLAWALFMFFGIAFSLRNYGVIPTNFWTLHGLQLGSMIGMLLLSFALANRIQDERRAKELAQAEAITAKQANIEQLQHSEHELEDRVSARTFELATANARLLESEQYQRDLAQHDMLTGLANRALFSDRVKQAMRISQHDRTRFALLYLDLDKFKPVNDTYGHAVGDLLLKEVARRITHRVRDSDTVARIGGDEFVVVLHSIESHQSAVQVANIVRSALNQPFIIDGQLLNISCSIGVQSGR